MAAIQQQDYHGLDKRTKASQLPAMEAAFRPGHKVKHEARSMSSRKRE